MLESRIQEAGCTNRTRLFYCIREKDWQMLAWPVKTFRVVSILVCARSKSVLPQNSFFLQLSLGLGLPG